MGIVSVEADRPLLELKVRVEAEEKVGLSGDVGGCLLFRILNWGHLKKNQLKSIKNNNESTGIYILQNKTVYTRICRHFLSEHILG